MLVTCETSQRWIGPYLMSRQFPLDDCLRHSDTAFFSAFLDGGENVVMGTGESFAVPQNKIAADKMPTVNVSLNATCLILIRYKNSPVVEFLIA